MESTKNRSDDLTRGTTNHCEICGADFPTAASLRSHENMAHHQPPEGATREPAAAPRDRTSPPDKEVRRAPENPAGKQPWENPNPQAPGRDRPAPPKGRTEDEMQSEGQVPYGAPVPGRDQNPATRKESPEETSERENPAEASEDGVRAPSPPREPPMGGPDEGSNEEKTDSETPPEPPAKRRADRRDAPPASE